MKSSFFAAVFTFTPSALATTYSLAKEYSGTDFFTGWDFYGNYDNSTNGDVTWQDKANATSESLAYVNSAGRAIIKVDNTTDVVYNYKRDSVRITTQDYFSLGSIFVMDATHLPYGCSVWPAFWTKGTDWPNNGEIDIAEGVNVVTNNQMTLHTASGCYHNSSTETGTIGTTDCSSDDGCTVTDANSDSYGSGFASAGGGVWAAQFDTTGINIWFFNRSSIPTAISDASSSSSVDPSSWGTPSAAFSTSDCDISEYFGSQQMILDITLCGDWAGSVTNYEPACGGDGTASACYVDNVVGTGSGYANAYFEINYVRVFMSANATISTEASTATGASSSDGMSVVSILPGLKWVTAIASTVAVSTWFVL